MNKPAPIALALEALELSRDDVCSVLNDMTRYAGYPRYDKQIAEHTEQLKKHDAAIEALKAAPQQEPWSTRENFYAALDRVVENVRQDMAIKTVTMRVNDVYDMRLNIVDSYAGHVLVGYQPIPAQPVAQPFQKTWQAIAEEAAKQNQMLLEALKELSLYVAHNGDDWVQRKARAAIKAAEATNVKG